jgi:integrase
MIGVYDPEGLCSPPATAPRSRCRTCARPSGGLLDRAGLPSEQWTTYELRHTFVSVVSDQLGDLTKVADLAGHADTKTTEGYRHAVRETLPHAINAWDSLLKHDDGAPSVSSAP